MALDKYYQEELAFLRELGQEFARAYPAQAHLLAEGSTDPDVERLLEGFAFLTGRVRQKLDDEFPEIVHALMGLLWPHYLRPVPAMSILEFLPIPHFLREPQRIPRGTEVESIPVEGTRCRFRTCFDVDLYPLELEDAQLDPAPGGGHLRIRIGVPGTVKFPQLGLERMRVHLHGDPHLVSTLYFWLCRKVKGIHVRAVKDKTPGREVELPGNSIRPAGFAEDESILPYPRHSFIGYRLLQEYFALPEKFFFIDIENLARTKDLGIEEGFEISVAVAATPDDDMRLGKENLSLYSTPVVNLFRHEADPIRVAHEATSYRVRPAGPDPRHHEVYSVDRVVGHVEGRPEEKEYPPFFAFRQPGTGEAIYHYTRLHEAMGGEGTETYVSFVDSSERPVSPATEIVSVDLTATNRHLPRALRVGDIKEPTRDSPEFARFRNIGRVTAPVHPPLDGSLHWRLLSHLSLNYVSLLSPESLRGILDLYNLQALRDRQAARENELRLQAIQAIRTRAEERLYRGSPIRGSVTEVDLDENGFAGEGDLYLFGSVLSEFLALYATLNSFSELTIRGARHGEIYRWQPSLGRQCTL